MKKSLLTALFLLFAFTYSRAQCPPGNDWVVVEIVPDNYPLETSWSLLDLNGNVLLSGAANSDSVCIPDSMCIRFRIQDSYGDGICCGFGQGSYTVYLNGVMQVTGGEFDYVEERYIGCPPGSNCDNAGIAFTDTIYQASGLSTWYEFTPDSTGTYEISTCFPDNFCNTRLWVYDHCAGLQFDSTNIGSLYYSDSACGQLAFINAGLVSGTTYYIRVGGDSSCYDSLITWQVIFGGPIVGCMDSTACNFNPLATVSNGNCIYPGDPNCTTGPDLEIDQATLQSTLSTGTVNGNDACLIGEGCLAGYGVRDVIRFTTTIRNIGDADYYIGPPQTGNSQFVFDQCHGHWHYAGYASYELYDSTQQQMSVGFKNGFCVLDLSCFSGIPQYGCSNMGISAGCADTYGAGLSCQWIDITDVPAGNYTLVVKVNWDHSPDKLGRVEQRFDNNVGYVCVNITRNAQNVPSITVMPTCAPIIDCAGDTFGLAQLDCDSVCNGLRLSGDLNLDTIQNATDITMYMDGIVNAGAVVSCNDLNGDAALTVADAALLNSCIRNNDSTHTHPGGTQNTHRHCQFPYGILNTTDTVRLGIGYINTSQQYIDLQVINADCDLTAIEFILDDVTIDSVVSVVSGFDPLIYWNTVSGRVAVLDTAENPLIKQQIATNLLRVYYSGLSSNTICINSVTEAVNADYETTLHAIFNGCFTITGINSIYNSHLVKVLPNPSSGIFRISAESLEGMPVEMQITDALGNVIWEKETVMRKSEAIQVDLSAYATGVYLMRLKAADIIVTERILKF
jgi:hypothetical protein